MVGFYGDDQAAYTQMRASFGPFGGMMVGGMGSPVAGGYGQTDQQIAGHPLASVGSAIRPVVYMPPPRVFNSVSGQYVQPTGLFRSLGNMFYNEPPRNVSFQEFTNNAATDFGERAGSGLAAAGITTAGIAAGTLMAPLGSAVGRLVGSGLGGFAGSMLGPAATLGMGSFMGGVGALAGGLAAPLLTAAAAAKVTDLMNEQRQVRNFLETSSFRSVAATSGLADSRQAAGMGPQARARVAEMLTQMDVKDSFMDMGDLTRVLQGATSMGLLNNVTNMDDFKKKFKDLTENVKTVARTLNTTLEEGLKTIKELKGIGMDPSQSASVVTQSDTLGRVAGKTASEMFTLGIQGAELFRGTGVSMEIGFRASQMNAAAVRSARDAGLLSNEAVAQAGGEEALAMRLTAGGLAFQQSALGRGMTAAFVQGGALNRGAFMSNMTQGGMGMTDLALQAAQNMSSPASLLKMQANQAKILSEVGKTFGGEGAQLQRMTAIMSQAQFMQSAIPDLDTESAFRAAAQQMGVSEPEIETMMARMKNADTEFAAKQKSAEAIRTRENAQSAYENLIFTRMGSRIKDLGTSAANVIAAPAGRFVDRVAEGTRIFTEELAGGYERADVSRINMGANSVTRLLANRGRTAELGDFGQVDLDAVGVLAESAGEALAARIGSGESLTRNFGITNRGAKADILLDKRAFGRNVGISKDDLKRLSQQSDMFRMTESDASDLKKSDAYQEAEQRILVAMGKTNINTLDSGTALVRALTGKEDLSKITKEEYAAVINATKGTRGADLVNELRVDANTIQRVTDATDAKTLQLAQRDFEEKRKSIGGKLGMELGEGVLEQLGSALQLKGDAQQAAMVRAAKMQADASGGDYQQILGSLQRRLGGGGPLAAEVMGSADRLVSLQTRRGLEAKKQELMAVSKEGDVPAGAASAIGSIQSKLTTDASSVINLSADERKVLRESKLSNLAALSENLGKVQDLMARRGELGTEFGSQMGKALDAFGLSKESRADLMREAASGKDASVVTNTLYSEFLRKQASQTGVTSSGGQRDQSMGAGTAQDTYALQTNVNQEILTALRALSAKLDSGR